ncbi:hypothetical protein D9C73_000805 [Collichthys lucidus]|uniref:Uncharacterized protein n=1 Tax=Collichthys lucidus TaxID=240159 RepID=A0A4U5U383_COLLU|nr:hypothetical protein D9C73_000805 [Collichthys lucidus]
MEISKQKYPPEEFSCHDEISLLQNPPTVELSELPPNPTRPATVKKQAIKFQLFRCHLFSSHSLHSTCCSRTSHSSGYWSCSRRHQGSFRLGAKPKAGLLYSLTHSSAACLLRKHYQPSRLQTGCPTHHSP